MKNTIYSIAHGVAIVAAMVSIVLVVLIGANAYRYRTAPALSSPEMASLIDKAHQNPSDEALKQTIRALDQKARYVFFSSERFNRNAGVLLAAAVILMLIALKMMTAIRRTIQPPQTSGSSEPDDMSSARWLLGAVAVSMTGLGIFMSVPPQGDAGPACLQTRAGEESNTVVAANEKLPSLDDLKKNWPGFRGVDNVGVAYCSNTPTVWDGKTGRGIVWKTAIPKPGVNSPVIWGDSVFLSGADETGRSVFCLNRATGAFSWSQNIPLAKGALSETGKINDDTGLAASTVATDGKRVYAMFPNGDMVALDFAGRQQWLINIGMPGNSYGFASSPVYCDGLLFVQFDQESGGKVFAVKAGNGAVEWSKSRDVSSAWASPSIVRQQSSVSVVLAAAKNLIAYDLKAGTEQWSIECLDGEVAPSPAVLDSIVFATQEGSSLAAVDAAGKKLLWKTEENLPAVSSPVAANGVVITAMTDAGRIACSDAKTGKVLWTHEVESGFYSSPVAAGDTVYAVDRTGRTQIFRAAGEWKELGKCELGEAVDATPAIVGDRIYIRGKNNLYCIGSTDE